MAELNWKTFNHHTTLRIGDAARIEIFHTMYDTFVVNIETTHRAPLGTFDDMETAQFEGLAAVREMLTSALELVSESEAD